MENVNECSKRWIEPIGEEDTDSCKTLWMAVIAQQIIDARSVSKKKKAIKRREEALVWLSETGSTSDYAEACHLAGIDPDCFREQVRFFLENPDETIDFRCCNRKKSRPEAVAEPKRFEESQSITETSDLALVTVITDPKVAFRSRY